MKHYGKRYSNLCLSLLFSFVFAAQAGNQFLVSPSEQLSIDTKGLVLNTTDINSKCRPSLWIQDETEDPHTNPHVRSYSSKVFCKVTALGPGACGDQKDLDATIRQQFHELAGITIAQEDIGHYHLTNGIGSYYAIYHPELARQMEAVPGMYDWATVGIIRIGKFSFSVNGCSQTNNDAAYKKMVSVLESMAVSRSTKTDADAALLEAAYSGDFNGAQTSVSKGAEIDAINVDGWTPLMYAAKNGHDNVALYLIEKGADVNRKTRTTIGSTVLEFATGGNKLNVMETVLNHGANVNAKGKDGTTPLILAASYGELDAARLLISRGADVNILGTENELHGRLSPLMAAGAKGHTNLMELLVAHGAMIDMTNESGDTALMMTSKFNRAEAVSWLIKHGANVNARGVRGHTALIYAAYNGRIDNIKLLLDAGADSTVTATDAQDPNDQEDRYSAVDVANCQGHPDAAEVIRDGKRTGRVRL